MSAVMVADLASCTDIQNDNSSDHLIGNDAIQLTDGKLNGQRDALDELFGFDPQEQNQFGMPGDRELDQMEHRILADFDLEALFHESVSAAASPGNSDCVFGIQMTPPTTYDDGECDDVEVKSNSITEKNNTQLFGEPPAKRQRMSPIATLSPGSSNQPSPLELPGSQPDENGDIYMEPEIEIKTKPKTITNLEIKTEAEAAEDARVRSGIAAISQASISSHELVTTYTHLKRVAAKASKDLAYEIARLKEVDEWRVNLARENARLRAVASGMTKEKEKLKSAIQQMHNDTNALKKNEILRAEIGEKNIEIARL